MGINVKTKASEDLCISQSDWTAQTRVLPQPERQKKRGRLKIRMSCTKKKARSKDFKVFHCDKMEDD